MNLNQFTQKWLGKRTDYDKVYAYQCVDLILQYLAEVDGITSGVWGNAIDYWTNPTKTLLQHYEKVSGTARAGDIVILNTTPTNPYGHIMIAINDTTAIEQNGATGDGDGEGGDEVRYRTIPYTRVAGLLRKKGNLMNKDQIAEFCLFLRLGNGESVEHANANSENDVKQIMANPAYAGALAKQLYKNNELFRYKAWNYDKIANELSAVRTDLEAVKNQVAELTKALSIKDGEIARLNDENAVLKAKLGDTQLTVKQAIKVLYQTVIDAIKS